MATYRVEVKRTAAKEIERLPPDVADRVMRALEPLAGNPRPLQSRKLHRSESTYRIRVGDYRIVYQVDDVAKCVVVQRVAHRSQAYR